MKGEMNSIVQSIKCSSIVKPVCTKILNLSAILDRLNKNIDWDFVNMYKKKEKALDKGRWMDAQVFYVFALIAHLNGLGFLNIILLTACTAF